VSVNKYFIHIVDLPEKRVKRPRHLFCVDIEIPPIPGITVIILIALVFPACRNLDHGP
jgi:hypothetical protein